MRRSAIRRLLAAAIALNVAVIWLWRRTGRRQTLPTPAAAPRETPRSLAPDSPQKATVSVRPTGPLAQEVGSALRVEPLIWLVIALALAVVGQLYFMERPNPSANGVIFYLLAILAFTLAVVRANRLAGHPASAEDIDSGSETAQADRDRSSAKLEQRRVPKPIVESGLPNVAQTAAPPPWRVIALTLVVVLTLILLDLLRRDPPLTDYTVPFMMWLGTIGLYLMAVAPPRHLSFRDWGPRWRLDRRIAATLAIIVVAAFGLRVWQLETIPGTLAGDEGTFGLESIKTITGEIRNPFTTGWLSVPTMSFYFNSLAIRLFGQTVFALRLPWALVGTVTVPIVFHLVRRLAGSTLGLMASALLATYHFHVHYSRLGINNATDPLLIALVLLLLYRAIDRRSQLGWALCGAAVGVAQYFYFGARFAVILVSVLVVYSVVRGGIRFLREHGRGIPIMIGAAIVAAAPMIQYAIRFPLDYNARINQIGIIQSGWLEREQGIRNQSALPILLDQLQRAVLAFNVYPDRFGFYSAPGPLFDFATGVLFLLGLGYATLRPGDSRLFPMVAWWWGGTILGGALTVNPPSTHRLVTLGPPAVFFAALALLKIGQIVQRAWNVWSPRHLVPYLAAAVLAISIASVNWYFVEFTPLRVYGTFNAVVATEMATYMRDRLGPDWRVYFFGPPRMYFGFGTIAYLAPTIEGVDVLEPLVAPPDPGLALPDKNAAFLFLPERQSELDLVRQTFPDGTLDEISSPVEGQPLFIVYRVLVR